MEKEKYNILIIDDDFELLDLMKDYLRNLGYSVYISRDGEEGFFMVKRYSIDVIITDIVMPNVSGFQLMERLQKVGFKGKVIVISGLSIINEMINQYSDYVFDFIKKPFKREVIVSSISRAIEHIQK